MVANTAAMVSVSLMSLHDALLDRVLRQLVPSDGTKRTLSYFCLINKRFAALVKQPLAAWTWVTVATPVSPAGTAYLARWLALVSPAVASLYLLAPVSAPVCAFLVNARHLQVSYQGHSFIEVTQAPQANSDCCTPCSAGVHDTHLNCNHCQTTLNCSAPTPGTCCRVCT